MSDPSAGIPTFSWKWLGLTILGLSALSFAILVVTFVQDPTLPRDDRLFLITVVPLFSGVFYGGIGYLIFFGIRKGIYVSRFRLTTAVAIHASSEALQGSIEQDFVTNLVKINFKYIDSYYLQTRIQADKSFTFTVVAASVSLMLIIAGIVFTYADKVNSAAVSASAGILGEFISAVFFYLYNKTVEKMADYHRKLVFTQNIGLALKISDGLPAREKKQAQLALIETLSKDVNQYLSA